MGYLIWRKNALVVESTDVHQLTDRDSRGHEGTTANLNGYSAPRRHPMNSLDADLNTVDLSDGDSFRNNIHEGKKSNATSEAGEVLDRRLGRCQESVDRVHSCRRCGELLFGLVGLRHHVELFHSGNNKRYACGKCCKKFSKRKCLVKHINKYNFQCKLKEKKSIIKELSVEYYVETGTDKGVNMCIDKSCDEYSFENSRKESVGENCVETLPYKPGYLKEDESYDKYSPENEPKKMTFDTKTGKTHKSNNSLSGIDKNSAEKFQKNGCHISGGINYACRCCNLAFVSNVLLEDHLKECRLRSTVKEMDVSKKLSPSKSIQESHTVLDSTKKRFVCDVCDNCLESKKELVSHMKEVHQTVKPVVCLLCYRGFHSYMHLGIHQAVHKDEKPLVCDTCDNRYSCQRSYKMHMLRCQRKVLFLCNICGKDFCNPRYLREHQFIHDQLKKYLCQHCKKRFSDNSNLRSHIRLVHTKIKPHECEICQKRFTSTSQLTSHRRIHSDERPFVCEVCGKSFKRRPDLREHKLNVHKIIDENVIRRNII